MRLLCFPPAGAGATWYRSWVGRLPATVVPVQPPGRESRIGEPSVSGLDALVDLLVGELARELRPPFALFGHSMGALVAWRLAVRLAADGRAQPERLYVSGHRAPQVEDRRRPLHGLPDDELVEGLRELGGTPSEIFEHPELLRVVLPALRADLAVVEGFVDRSTPALACPIVGFTGREDREVEPADVAAWAERTSDGFRMVIVPGDHFASRANPDSLLRELASDLARARHEVGRRAGGS